MTLRQEPHLILVNLAALPATAATPAPDLIAITGNRISYAGPRDALGDLAAPHTRLLDCQGGLVIPGFNDAHCHPVAHAATLRHVDCSPARVASIAAVQAALREYSGTGQWVRAGGCDGAALAEGRLPTRRDLDDAVSDRPVILVEHSGQCCVLNTMAITTCGLTDAVGSDGIVPGNDERLTRALPPLTAEELEAGLRQASRLYLEQGITSLHDTSWSNGHRHWLALRHFKQNGILAPRVTMLAGIGALEEFTGRGLKTGAGDAHLRLGAMKIALDESTASPHPPQEDWDTAALRAHLAGFQLSFHVPDLTLLQRALRSLAMVRELSLTECVRPRFEHCPVCPPALLPDIAEAGAVLVMQPNLLFTTGPRYLRHLDQDQLSWISPIRSILAAGIGVAFGSDAPLTPSAPFPAMATAVTRRVDGGASLAAAEGIAVETALRCYSSAGAFCSQEEHLKGGIAAGMLADLAILDRNPLALPSDQLGASRVMITLLDGRVAWQS